MTTDYTVKGLARPDMTSARFVAVLRAANSPVSDAEAEAVYAYCSARKVSMAWLLAVFAHESSMGKAGTATQTHSWGNTRRPSFGAPSTGEVAGRSGMFSAYIDWAFGGMSTVARVCDHKPYANANTVRQITPIWAPPSDQNDTERYIQAVLADIDRYAAPAPPGQQGGATMPVPKPAITSSPSPNWGGYKHPHDPRCIVWHITQGTNSLGWLQSPASGASSNYLIARDGTTHELVPPTVSAWANGQTCKPDMTNDVIAKALGEGRNLNTVSVSIEHEGFTSNNKGGSLTAAQVAATIRLTAWLCSSLGIPPDQDHILGHYQADACDRPYCPGFSSAEWSDWVVRVAALVNGAAPAPAPAQPGRPVGYLPLGTPDTFQWEGEGVIVHRTVRYYMPDTDTYYDRVWSAENGYNPWVQVQK